MGFHEVKKGREGVIGFRRGVLSVRLSGAMDIYSMT